MTIELKEALDLEMDSAMSSGDQSRINIAQIHYNKAMADCQFKTAQRVKEIALATPEIQSDVKAIRAALAGSAAPAAPGASTRSDRDWLKNLIWLLVSTVCAALGYFIKS